MSVMPYPKRVYGTCNRRVAYVHHNYLSVIVVFFNVVFKDESVKFSKNCGIVKPKKKIY